MSDNASRPAASSAVPPDAVVTQTGGTFACSVTDEALLRIRQRAAKPVSRASASAYAEFPIDQANLTRKILGGLLTERNICRTLVSPKISEQDHNSLRARYNAERLSAENGAALGIIGTRLPLEARCQQSYDWKASPVYAGADSCEDVTEEFEGGGIPTVLYSTELPAAEAVEFLSAPATAPFYTRYANDGPLPCACSAGGNTFFHVIRVWGTISAEFAMRTFRGEHWSAWTLVDSCTTADGVAHHPDDLMFDFGIRVFVPIEAEIDGRRVERTLVIGQVAATSESVLAKLVPQQISLERFFGGEYAKKILLEAKARGWKIEKTK